VEQKHPSAGGASTSPSVVRFGEYELDLRTAELRRRSQRIRLQEQPFLILLELLEHPGQLVTREEIRQRLWPGNTTVEFDHSINAAIKRLRDSLADSAESPRFIETIAKRGYRFIAPVEPASLPTESDLNEKQTDLKESPRKPLHFRPAIITAAVLAVGIVASVWIAFFRVQGKPKVVRFTRLTSDGQKKIGPLVSDGVRVYFNEWLPDGQLIIAQVLVHGGEVVPLSVPLREPFIQDITKDGTELLVANEEGMQGRSIWVQPVAGGSPHRVGTALTSWGPLGPGLDYAAFAKGATHIVYSQGHDVYSVSRDGSSLEKILTTGHLTRGFRYSNELSGFAVHRVRSLGTGSDHEWRGRRDQARQTR
jgi:DNA-binding winged helix-turn-helix (wHTH) protein